VICIGIIPGYVRIVRNFSVTKGVDLVLFSV